MHPCVAVLFTGCGQTRPHRLPVEGALSPTKAFPVCFVFVLSRGGEPSHAILARLSKCDDRAEYPPAVPQRAGSVRTRGGRWRTYPRAARPEREVPRAGDPREAVRASTPRRIPRYGHRRSRGRPPRPASHFSGTPPARGAPLRTRSIRRGKARFAYEKRCREEGAGARSAPQPA